MNIEEFRIFCLSLPDTTEDIKWDNVLCFCVMGKIFALVPLDQLSVSFKITPDEFQNLIEREGFKQAYHLKKGQWISMQDLEVTHPTEIFQLVRNSYRLVIDKLPLKLRKPLLEKLDT